MQGMYTRLENLMRVLSYKIIRAIGLVAREVLTQTYAWIGIFLYNHIRLKGYQTQYSRGLPTYNT